MNKLATSEIVCSARKINQKQMVFSKGSKTRVIAIETNEKNISAKLYKSSLTDLSIYKNFYLKIIYKKTTMLLF